jgi:hypothetical protein
MAAGLSREEQLEVTLAVFPSQICALLGQIGVPFLNIFWYGLYLHYRSLLLLVNSLTHQLVCKSHLGL